MIKKMPRPPERAPGDMWVPAPGGRGVSPRLDRAADPALIPRPPACFAPARPTLGVVEQVLLVLADDLVHDDRVDVHLWAPLNR